MGYNAAFTGGVLSGTVRVPAAVFEQLSARAANYNVPWATQDLPIAWLNPSRLIVYVDVNRSIAAGVDIPGELNGVSVPVQVCGFVCENIVV